MNEQGIHLTVCRMDEAVVAAELYVQCEDMTIDWYASLHDGDIDPAVIDAQIRAHYESKRPHPSREW